MEREAFLRRVGDAARAGQAYRVGGTRAAPDTGYVGAGHDLVAALAGQIESVGGTAEIVVSHQAARHSLEILLERHQARAVLCWQHPVLVRAGLEDLLRQRGTIQLDHSHLCQLAADEQRDAALAADVGISTVDVAIAETGTLMLCSRPGQERIASLLPPVHVAVVEQDQIVPDLFDAFQRLEPGQLSSNIVFITGPSKTGDIELQLTTGVHGPGTWHVIIIRRQYHESSR